MTHSKKKLKRNRRQDLGRLHLARNAPNDDDQEHTINALWPIVIVSIAAITCLLLRRNMSPTSTDILCDAVLKRLDHQDTLKVTLQEYYDHVLGYNKSDTLADPIFDPLYDALHGFTGDGIVYDPCMMLVFKVERHLDAGNTIEG